LCAAQRCDEIRCYQKSVTPLSCKIGEFSAAQIKTPLEDSQKAVFFANF
jgi:hypothetical protein